MKRVKYFGMAMMAVLTVGMAVYLDSCKKEVITPINNMVVPTVDVAGYTDEAKEVVGLIKRFKRQVSDKEAVAIRSALMPIDSVVWNLEALFNAEYTFPERKYLEMARNELEFFVEIDANGNAQVGVVADLYDEITNAVRQVYANDGISSDKSLMAVVIDKGDIVGNQAELKVYVISGKMDTGNSVKEPLEGPFGPGDCWYFGEYGGTCDDPSVFGDAAEIIEDTINYYYGGAKVPQSGFRSLNYSMTRISLDGNEYVDENGEPYLYFYSVNSNPPFYLNYELLNYYYLRELEVLLHLVPSDPRYQGIMPPNPAFVEVDISGMLGFVGNGNCVYHKNYAVYGNKCFVPVQTLSARDLLNP